MMNHCYNGYEVRINAKPVEPKVVVRESEYASWPVIFGRASVYFAMLAFCVGFWLVVGSLLTRMF